jgi:hypothetical protein
MPDSSAHPRLDGTDLRRLLHATNAELSVATLGLDLLLESAALEPSVRLAVQESLDACRQAAARLREVWVAVDRGTSQV